ncbi:hypothetical protein A3C23_01965 [Candidatus Roizmanbacteria bacterium RIFCSPHIGHO2_02_FULL_37_13b]|uniref:Lipopolysaccharide assembly protein A domain-containing protein n=1 Tax=Candidatus Roizmanbacteria bacterium RIFCSPLOWO2_02_FULL_36_11 TaxID=1802071 RepID=A0A1F7JBM6_9BACT|nr:MAG: hypothetical protein A3C23_01965 [Candidatus Roizmanbacteria bacterium RIFCSPHIGHO2_02_FULL_37_13b]OGK53018.1 MAG: hypothetical protein A3H78_02285 [Candidatus Roizmanbacteria bacterium RIFCSPLOWO2_02_FULL_36_11]
METLLLLVLFAIIAAVFATQNTISVPMMLFGYSIKAIPLYLVVFGSILIGLLSSSIISLVNSISTSFRLHGKDVKIKETKKTVTDLTKRNHELEQEITKLKEQNAKTTTEKQA